MPATPELDGSDAANAHDTVVIDRSSTSERWRYRCPHVNWSRTNNHIWAIPLIWFNTTNVADCFGNANTVLTR